jgi:hypothetical protein
MNINRGVAVGLARLLEFESQCARGWSKTMPPTTRKPLVDGPGDLAAVVEQVATTRQLLSPTPTTLPGLCS